MTGHPTSMKSSLSQRNGFTAHAAGDAAFLAGPDGQEEGHGLHKKKAASKEDRSDNFF